MKTRRIRLVICTFVVGIAIILLAAPQSNVVSSQIPSGFAASNDTQQKETCQVILNRAMETLNNTCDKLERNNACYGNNAVVAELDGTGVKFNTLGDRAPIRVIKKLITSPLDIQKGTWGLSLLKLQANLPDTMPGQNVLFLVYGNIALENTSGNMQAFYFTSGLGSPACKEAPRDGILVRSPNHTEVAFTANGVQITIASTVILRAERGKTLDVLLVEGHARVTTPQGSQTLQPGQTVSVPLGGSSGLDPVSQPSAPVAAAADPALPVILVSTEKFTPAHAPINVSVEGCITRVQGNTATIEGQDIQFQANDPVLAGSKAGDCVRVNGSLQADQGKSVIIAIPASPNPPGGNGDGTNLAASTDSPVVDSSTTDADNGGKKDNKGNSGKKDNKGDKKGDKKDNNGNNGNGNGGNSKNQNNGTNLAGAGVNNNDLPQHKSDTTTNPSSNRNAASAVSTPRSK